MNVKSVFRQQMAKLEDQVNARSLRERVLMLASVVMLIFILWRNLILGYLSSSTEQIVTNKERLASQIKLMKVQIETLSESIKNDSTITLDQKLKEAVLKNIRLKDKINQYISGFMKPKEMITVLKSLLSLDDHIKIEKMESLEDRPVFSEKSDILLYDKGIRLEIESDYISTLSFLEKIEKSESKILWDTLTYEVTKYPLAKITLTVHTIGTEKGWLHV